jgi:hypothetical protein
MEAKRVYWLRLLLCLTFFLISGLNQPSTAQSNPWVNPTRPNNCEDALALLDETALEARKNKESNIIVVARLGDGEKFQSLNRRRLKDVVEYLKGKAENMIVAASGERVKGYGRLEFYVSGKLLYVIAYPRRGIIDCRDIG